MQSFADPLTVLIEKAKSRGYVTFQEVNAYLPDEGGSALLIDDLVLALDSNGLNLMEDPRLVKMGGEGIRWLQGTIG